MAEMLVNLGPKGVLLQAQAGSRSYDRALIVNHFRFFFSTNNAKTAPADQTDTDGDGVPDSVDVMLQQLVHAHHVYANIVGLPDFFCVGYMYRQGIRYVDVLLDDIPIQRGLMSSVVADTTPDFVRGSGYAGPSVTLRLHRALPKASLTPAHELFHLFQFASLPFLNMWFMEGLARHGQRWLDNKRPQSSPLPQTQAQLESLLQQWHDSEGFWNRLGELCDPDIAESVVEQRDSPARIANPFLVSQRFLGIFFRHARQQMLSLCAEMPGRHLSAEEQWPSNEKRSGANNSFLLRAVCGAISEIAPPHHPELDGFTALIRELDGQAAARARTPEVQRFLRTLQRHGLASVDVAADGSLQCDAYDPVTGTLSLPEVVFPAGQLDNTDLDSFIVVRHLIGTLHLQDQPALTRLDGLAALAAVEGNLVIERSGVESLTRALPALQRIKGYLHILQNQKLETLTGFNALTVIDHALVISGHPGLRTFAAFLRLQEIKKGELVITGSPQLEVIQGFDVLQAARGVHLEKLAIRHVDFLRPLFARNPDFPGAIRLVYCLLEHIRALSGLRTVASSLYLHGNVLTELYPLHQLSRVGNSLSLSGNRIKYLHALGQLTEVNGMLGLMNNQLESLDGLENLRVLKTVKWNHESRTLALKDNPKLNNLEALANVTVKDAFIVDVNIWESCVLPVGIVPFYRNSFNIGSSGEGVEPVSVLCSIKHRLMTRNLVSRQNFNVFSIEFADLDTVLAVCAQKHLDVLFATTPTAIRFIHKHHAVLKSAGLKYIVPSAAVLKKLVYKDVFYHFMEFNGFGEYIPTVYHTPAEMKFPCIKKSKSNFGGKGQQSVDSEADVCDDFATTIYSEYIGGAVEYAANILIVGGRIVYAQYFEKYTTDEFYILGVGEQSYAKVQSRPVAAEFKDIFEKIMSALGCEGFYCIDYKKSGNKPKIFEINARIGLTNGAFPALLERSIRAYCTVLGHARPLSKNERIIKEICAAGENDFSGSPYHHVDMNLVLAMIRDAAQARGYQFEIQNKLCFRITSKENWEVFQQNNPGGSIVSSHICMDKDMTKKLLRLRGIPVPEGRVFQYRAEAHEYFLSRKRPQVVKPRDGSAGNGVTAGISEASHFSPAWDKARQYGKKIIVEDYVSGDEVRVILLGNRVVAAVCRLSAHVVGDGVHRISELVKMKNIARGKNPTLKNNPITDLGYLAISRRSLDDVPASGEYVQLSTVSNVFRGGESVNIMGHLNQAILDLAVNATAAIPGSTLLGLDILVRDFTSGTVEGNATVIEVNFNAGLPIAYFPTYGPPVSELPGAMIDFVRAGGYETANGPIRAAQVKPADFYLTGAATRSIPPTVDLLRQAALAKNFTVETISNDLLLISHADRSVAFFRGMCSWNRNSGHSASNDKAWTKKLLKSAGINTPNGIRFSNTQKDNAWERFRESEALLVIKPVNDVHGHNELMETPSRERFDSAFDAVVAFGAREVLIEEFVPGNEYRFFVAGNAIRAVTQRRQLYPLGNRKQARDTPESEDGAPKNNPRNSPEPISPAPAIQPDIAPDALHLSFESGETHQDVTDSVHPGFAEIAARVREAMYAPAYFGFDLIAEDISAPPDEQRWSVIRVTAHPNLALHHFPSEGTPRDVSGALLEFLLADGSYDHAAGGM